MMTMRPVVACAAHIVHELCLVQHLCQRALQAGPVRCKYLAPPSRAHDGDRQTQQATAGKRVQAHACTAGRTVCT